MTRLPKTVKRGKPCKSTGCRLPLFTLQPCGHRFNGSVCCHDDCKAKRRENARKATPHFTYNRIAIRHKGVFDVAKR